MKPYLFFLSATALAASSDRQANTIILDQTGVGNLRIQTEAVGYHTFESTVYALGHLDEIPANRSVLSTRVPGRILELKAYKGDKVEKGQVLAVMESRQPGNPPPKIELKAPRSGTVVDSHISTGQPVQPENELLDIADHSALWAIAHIQEDDVPGIPSGASARIYLPARGGAPLESKLDRYNTEANEHNGTVDAIFQVPNPDGQLRPGMTTEFHILTKRREKVMAIPTNAIQGPQAKPVVFVKDFDLPNAFIKIPVVTGETNDQLTEINSGLFPGDEIVTRGSYALAHASPGSGISLKEALDAAHGHEHNEDGSEMTPAQRAAKKAAANPGSASPKSGWLLPGSIAGGFALLALIQLIWMRKHAV